LCYLTVVKLWYFYAPAGTYYLEGPPPLASFWLLALANPTQT